MKTKLIALLPWKYIALASAAALCFGSTAKAQIQLDFVYNSGTGKTTVTYSGTWDVSATVTDITALDSPALADSTAFYAFTSGLDRGTAYYYYGIGNGVPYAWDSAGEGTVASGDTFGFSVYSVMGPVGFTDTTLISGSAYWDKSLTEMGFDAAEILSGGGSYSGAGGTVNWTVSGAVAVPEPSTYAAFLGGAALLLCIMRRRGARG